ncbi:MAG: YbaN family protein [Novosphingobium sp.]|nr:YbaN family protein [Novosphingobium sp.]
MRKIYLAGGVAAVCLAIIGIILPIVPTVPFLILAAWCFGKSNPLWEQRLLRHPHYGPHIRAWRERRAVARIGKWGATGAFAVSIVIGMFVLTWPWVAIPPGVAVLVLLWLWSRPDA